MIDPAPRVRDDRIVDTQSNSPALDPLLRVCGAPHVVHTQRGNNATHPDFQARPPQGISENDF